MSRRTRHPLGDLALVVLVPWLALSALALALLVIGVVAVVGTAVLLVVLPARAVWRHRPSLGPVAPVRGTQRVARI